MCPPVCHCQTAFVTCQKITCCKLLCSPKRGLNQALLLLSRDFKRRQFYYEGFIQAWSLIPRWLLLPQLKCKEELTKFVLKSQPIKGFLISCLNISLYLFFGIMRLDLFCLVILFSSFLLFALGHFLYLSLLVMVCLVAWILKSMDYSV